MTLLLIGILLAFVLGFSLHRAGICTLTAVAELLSTRRAFMLWSFFKTIAWIWVVSVLLMLLVPGQSQPWLSYPLTWQALAGGMLFGIGSTINGGCAFSTVTKLAQGRLQMALTLPAFIGGVKVYSMYFPTATPTLRTPHIDIGEPLAWLISMTLFMWVVWESRGLLRAFRSRRSLVRYLFARRYRLSAAAAVIGICNGFLYAIYGRWSYASGLIEQVAPVTHVARSSVHEYLYLFLAVLAGAFTSALRSGRFSLSLAPERWLSSLTGGFIMGCGVMMVPGGNAILMLQSMPQLSPHALPAFIAMLTGMAVAIRLQQAVTGKRVHVNCGGDYCRARL